MDTAVRCKRGKVGGGGLFFRNGNDRVPLLSFKYAFFFCCAFVDCIINNNYTRIRFQ